MARDAFFTRKSNVAITTVSADHRPNEDITVGGKKREQRFFGAIHYAQSTREEEWL
jgi:hypothetical protein